ncbi:hypothetical protein Tsubulata_050879 [Turnera subulata]|uniref:SNF2 N-terminal domain-containing protein n=1 Tax=Turnera subulata TaxID=218843 RepID=A0A9Q0GBC9_9ROSI|nr:hypothetical protein Tsubulata_050879 [Turnera subulata]
MDRLYAKIGPNLLRLKKDDVCLELPKKHDLTVWLRLTKCQQQQYKACLQSHLVRDTKNYSRFAALKTSLARALSEARAHYVRLEA